MIEHQVTTTRTSEAPVPYGVRLIGSWKSNYGRFLCPVVFLTLAFPLSTSSVPAANNSVPVPSAPSLSVLGMASWQDSGDETPGESGSVTIQLDQDSSGHSLFKVVGWDDIGLVQTGVGNYRASRWQDFFAVYVDSDSFSQDSEIPPILGSYRIESGALIFQPRYPLEPGVRYRAVFRAMRDPAVDQSGVGMMAQEIIATFELPKRDEIPSTKVEHVYPTTDLLPENQLKFYLHFSAPMSRGEAYTWLHLLDEAGDQVSLPFLELDQELWDGEGKRLTILFDPGRIKRGLLPHEEVGVPIKEGRKYTLVIDRRWLDAEGKPLKEGFEKSFSVRAPDRESPDLNIWRLVPPRDGTFEPFSIEFPEPMDHALLLRLLDVTDGEGNLLQGSIQVDRQETRWRFTPRRPWKAGDYLLVVGTILEDLAGNRIDRLFEVDVFERVDEQTNRETVSLPFKVQ